MTNPFYEGRVALITGGASGIGLALARELFQAGAELVLVDMDPLALAACEKEFEGAGRPVLALECDISDPKACIRAVDQTLDHYNRLDILFNNAGITARGLFEDTRISVFQRVMDTNFYGALYMTKAALPHLTACRGTIIVNESIAGVAPLLGRTGYAASKHALHGLFTTLRCELRSKGVHVMIICPGFIKTNLQARALGADGKLAAHAQTRVGRQQTPESVARTVAGHIPRKTPMLVFTFFGKLGYWISRLFPGVYERLMTRQFRSELSH
ncbi:MAG: SDR family oxidoreductase [Desulfobacterales bacterium]|nr:SDR family oxidoreductase [Desulfobacterales bacterium]